MQLQFLKNLKIDFMGRRREAMICSAALILISVVAVALRGLNFGLDFTGGTLVEVGYQEAVELTPVRKSLVDAGFDDAMVQHFGTSRDVLVRLAPKEEIDSAKLSDQAFAALRKASSGGADLWAKSSPKTAAWP